MFQKIIISILLSLFAISSIIAQPKLSTNSRKAKKMFNEAVSFYNRKDDNSAIKSLKDAIKKDDKFIEAYLLLGDIYYYHSEYNKEIDMLKRVIEIKPDYNTKNYMNLGQAYLLIGDYQSSLQNLLIYVSKEKSQRKVTFAESYINTCEFALDAIENPVEFNPINLGPKVNTKYNDYMPSITADEEVLVTTVDIPISLKHQHTQQNSQEDFFICYKNKEEWSVAQNMGKPLNTEGNEGSQSIMVDGKTMVFAACNREDGKGSCDIYFSKKIGNSWTPAQNMGYPINTSAWESQPSISSDGRTLYFVSNRKGGFGDKDIWMSQLGDDGYWQDPVNLGSEINTPEMDASPFIHADNQTLYFSSTGHIGMGGFDLFFSKQLTDGTFTKPVNLGYPINTFKDEEYLIVNAKGDKAYFSSNRPDSRKRDIYEFELYNEIRPTEVTYVKGIIYDAINNNGIKTTIELIDLSTSKKVLTSYSDKKNGQYLICLTTNTNYAFNVSKNGYLFHSENFSLKVRNEISEPYKMDIALSPIETGKSVVLKNIFFNTDSYNIKQESYSELDKLVSFMNLNIGIKIEVGGHTDNVGLKEYNLTLSTNRAESVYNYLALKGIKKERLSFKGYGMTMPIVNNDTSENRARNRRTEFKII